MLKSFAYAKKQYGLGSPCETREKLQEGAEIIFSDELSCTILEKRILGAVLPVFALTVF